jgi:hypothetical protein
MALTPKQFIHKESLCHIYAFAFGVLGSNENRLLHDRSSDLIGEVDMRSVHFETKRFLELKFQEQERIVLVQR